MTPPSLPPDVFDALPSAVQAYIRWLEAQAARVVQLEERIVQLEARLNQNSSDSSKPPSSDGPQVKPAPAKVPTGKARGGQPGHPKRTRPELPPDAVVELRPDACGRCAHPLTGTDPHLFAPPPGDSCRRPCVAEAWARVPLRPDGRRVPGTAGCAGCAVHVRGGGGRGADQQRGRAGVASRGVLAEDQLRHRLGAGEPARGAGAHRRRLVSPAGSQHPRFPHRRHSGSSKWHAHPVTHPRAARDPVNGYRS